MGKDYCCIISGFMYRTEIELQKSNVTKKNLVWKLFNDPEIGVQLKNKFAPLYYATSILIDNEESKLNLLKTPPEIEETVKDILNKIENLRKEYYPEN